MFKHIVSLSVISATLTLFSATSQAITVEEVANPRQTNGGWVTDMADILNSETEDKLNRLINNLERAEGTEIAVVTVPETAHTESSKAFATELFNHWGIGKANINNGILFLISYEENRVEIETGIGIEGILTDGEVKKIIDTQIIPQYKQNNFDRGTLDGTKALITSLDSAVVEDKTWHWSVFPLVGLGLALFTGGVISYRKRRNKIFIKPGTSRALQRIDNRAVHCAKCHQPMEKTKNIDLTPARQVAQKLGGVSYRGYRCPRCPRCSQDSKSYSILAYFSASNRFDDCPHCQELTVTKTGEVLEAATSESKGKFLSRKKCHCCDYQTEQIITIPCITPTSSRNRGQNNSNTQHYYDSSGGYGGGGGSGGGFGGGSSDGGGAGGSW